MSTLAVETGEKHPGGRSPAVVQQKSAVVTESKPAENAQGFLDEHPLVPVFITGIVAFVLSSAMIGSILLWLSLRHSGVMAP